MSSAVVNVHMCGREEGKRGQWGLGKGTTVQMGQLSMGGVEVSFFVQRATIPNKRLLFLNYYTPHMLLIFHMRFLYCMSKKIYSNL